MRGYPALLALGVSAALFVFPEQSIHASLHKVDRAPRPPRSTPRSRRRSCGGASARRGRPVDRGHRRQGASKRSLLRCSRRRTVENGGWRRELGPHHRRSDAVRRSAPSRCLKRASNRLIGMGETCIRGNIMAGDGVYKSTDAGKTWTTVGLADAHNISKYPHPP